MEIISQADNFVGEIVRGVGVFTIYAGMISGMYLTIQSIRAMDYKNITLYALMTGGLFYGLTKLNAHRPFQPVGPLHELELMSFDYDEEEAEWYQ
ncbi:MAG: hypothetical protein CMN00_03070 [Rickettsiales bacterium]|nr:hypothetical protein [Rickettsiales bacterium]|tara:strand:- start:1218 stop:1502 length:285 start_codon:yes stop_codon:yes gene_type:complete